MKYTKKPIAVEAVQWNGSNMDELRRFAGKNINFTREQEIIGVDIIPVISTLEGDMVCSISDYVIKGIKGEFYPCKADIFEESYTAYTPNCKHEELKKDELEWTENQRAALQLAEIFFWVKDVDEFVKAIQEIEKAGGME